MTLEDNSDHELLLQLNGKYEDQQKQLNDLHLYAQKLDAENDLMRSSMKTRTLILSVTVGVLTAVSFALLASVSYEYQTANAKFKFGLSGDTIDKIISSGFSAAVTGIPLAIAVYIKLKKDPLKVEKILEGESIDSD